MRRAVPVIEMHPYREPGQVVSPPAPVGATDNDDRTLAFVMIAIGALRVAIALIGGEAFGVEPTIATLMIILGAASLVPRSS